MIQNFGVRVIKLIQWTLLGNHKEIKKKTIQTNKNSTHETCELSGFSCKL